MLQLSETLLHTYQREKKRSGQAWHLWPNLLSLDAPAIAILWQHLFAQAFSIRLVASDRICLASAVWFIYLTDRILDVSSPTPPLTRRHVFYAEHRGLVGVLAALAFGIATLSACFLPSRVFCFGAVGSAVVVGYFYFVHRSPLHLRFAKETAVGVFFASGTALATFAQGGLHASSIAALLLFALLCTVNCLLVEAIENRSRALIHVGRSLAFLVAAVACMASFLKGGVPFHELYAAFAMAGVGTAYFARSIRRLSPTTARVVADVPLILPFILFLLGR